MFIKITVARDCLEMFTLEINKINCEIFKKYENNHGNFEFELIVDEKKAALTLMELYFG